ncbi:hypothetical protein [Alicyclobacillus macrosporangiidus]|uniref:Uncharacterized protein n=1 Tax=Alicyclobacillus macrosporangiidus TaxID=392015 RepID=A0A1I7GR78_9BACL|nr:hypothetical protein [Alicyclobacillus macrosporangiidus]SFU50982.1 hypothetical protein SAMN05421543_10315 [Alicyclobacillus macrosporangiidus]
MEARVYDRLCGWLCLALGITGWWTGAVWDYMRITRPEAGLWTALGVLAVLGARAKRREAFLVCCLLTFALASWAIWAWVDSSARLGTVEPLEGLIRLLAAVWGVYAAGSELARWVAR